MAWDSLDAPAQERLLRRQLSDAVAPFSPFWRERLRALGAVSGPAELRRLPAVGERDVSPEADPAAMAALVLAPSETGYAGHASGPAVRRALLRRLVSADAYRDVVEAETRPTSYLWTGLGFRWLLASTRADLDVLARCGRRLWEVLDLTSADVLLSAVPVARTIEHVGLEYAALAAGAPAIFAGPDLAELASVARNVPVTVLAAPAAAAADLVDDLAGEPAALATLRRLLVVGAPSPAEQRACRAALDSAGSAADVRAVHAPSGARVLWGECAPGSGLHTYPDVDLVELVDPETADPHAGAGPGELVLTQLGLAGSALVRWRTGDLVDGALASGPCPSCGRAVPRVAGLRRGALVVPLDGGSLDLRELAGALLAQPEVADWRVVLRRRARDGAAQVVVHLAPGDNDEDLGELAARSAAAIRRGTGTLPTQLVIAGAEGLPAVTGDYGRRTGTPAA